MNKVEVYAEFDESILDAMGCFLSQDKTWDQTRLMEAALSEFLMRRIDVNTPKGNEMSRQMTKVFMKSQPQNAVGEKAIAA